MNQQLLISLQDEFYKKLNQEGKSLNTLKNYKTDLDCFNQFLRENNNNLNIAKFNTEEILEYNDYLQNRYNSSNSKRRRVQALRMFFDFLVHKKIYSHNPVRKIPSAPKFLDIPRPTSFTDIKTIWTFLIEEAQNNPTDIGKLLARRNQVIVLLIFGGALKVSDLAILETQHLFIEKENNRVLITNTKRDPYTVPLPDIFLDVYHDYLSLYATLKANSKIESHMVLFSANPYQIIGSGLSPRGLETTFKDISKKLLIDTTPKSLRQAAIFNWLHQGHSDSLIKEWMGVAPSYSLNLYKKHLMDNIYTDQFLSELYKNY